LKIRFGFKSHLLNLFWFEKLYQFWNPFLFSKFIHMINLFSFLNLFSFTNLFSFLNLFWFENQFPFWNYFLFWKFIQIRNSFSFLNPFWYQLRIVLIFKSVPILKFVPILKIRSHYLICSSFDYEFVLILKSFGFKICSNF
jgi:hypothetical protein